MDKQALWTCNGMQFRKKRHGGTLNTHCYVKKSQTTRYTICLSYSQFSHPLQIRMNTMKAWERPYGPVFPCLGHTQGICTGLPRGQAHLLHCKPTSPKCKRQPNREDLVTQCGATQPYRNIVLREADELNLNQHHKKENEPYSNSQMSRALSHVKPKSYMKATLKSLVTWRTDSKQDQIHNMRVWKSQGNPSHN